MSRRHIRFEPRAGRRRAPRARLIGVRTGERCRPLASFPALDGREVCLVHNTGYWSKHCHGSARVVTPCEQGAWSISSGNRMTVTAIAVLVIVAAAFVWLGVEVVRELRRPPELRGDWWASFECEFRAYDRRRKPPNRSGA